MASGAAYLVRPEGAVAGLATACVAAALGFRRWPRSLTAGRLTALAVGFCILALPYMLVIGRVTNKPAGINILDNFNVRQQVVKEGAEAPRPVDSPVLFAAWYEGPDVDGWKPLWVAKTLVKETMKAGFYVPAALAVFGLLLVRRRFGPEPWLAVPLAFAVLTGGVLVVLGMKGTYLSERHTLSIVYVGCLFAAVGVAEVGTLVKRMPVLGDVVGERAAAGFVLAVLVAACVPATLKPLHENRVGHVHIGRYLAQEGMLHESDALIDPFDWAAFYSGRTLQAIPPDPGEPRVRWAVLELDKSGKPEVPHSVTPRHSAAMDVFNDRDNPAEVAFRWPENGPTKIVLLKQTVKK
jgi:hypothetical protein